MNRVTSFIGIILLGACLAPVYATETLSESEASQHIVHSSFGAEGRHDFAGSSILSMLFAQTALDREMPLALRPIMGVWLVSFLTLKSLEASKHAPATGFMHYCKERLLDNVGIPLYVAFDRIKHEGPRKQDLGVLGLTLLGLYGAKKCGDHLQLGSSIRSLDFSTSREVLAHDASFLWQHKGRIALGLAATGALIVAIKSALNLPIIERFRRSLTPQQKDIISSDETLRQLLERAHENPVALIDHDHFTSQLHEHQKELLDKAVQRHKSEADPMSLFDDFVMDDEDLS